MQKVTEHLSNTGEHPYVPRLAFMNMQHQRATLAKKATVDYIEIWHS